MTKVHVMRTVQQKPHYISQKYSPLITSLALPLTTRLLSHNQNYSLITKTTSPFCHQWQRVNHWQTVISSSCVEPEASSLSPSPLSEDSTEGLGKGEGAKPPRQDCQRVIRLNLVFFWHISSERWLSQLPKSTRISLSWSRMAARDASTLEEEDGEDTR